MSQPTDLSHIPNQELLSDLCETQLDIQLCREALSLGILEYSGGKVINRLQDNKEILTRIRREIEGRKIPLVQIETGGQIGLAPLNTGQMCPAGKSEA
jgi:hypothetical protein